MKRILLVLAFVAGGYLAVRALVEPFVVDFSDPSSYESDWGGPSPVGVLAVHMGPGVISVVLFFYWLNRFRRRKSEDSTSRRNPDEALR